MEKQTSENIKQQNYFFKIRELKIDEIEELLIWIDKFELSRQSKKLNRDFSDCVLLAEILKKLYPKLVEIHNYPPRNSFQLKMDNWYTINRKVLRKINCAINYKTMELLSKGHPGTIESLLYEIMIKYREYIERPDFEDNATVTEDFNYDSDVMIVNIQKRTPDETVEFSQKMILYSIYQNLEDRLNEKNESIAILNQKVEHLEGLLNLKSQRIEDLSALLIRKNKRLDSSLNDINSILSDS